MNYVFRILLFLGCLSCHAEDRLTDSELQNLSWRVDSIVTGGLWHRSDGFGHCRLVVSSIEWAEYTTHQVCIQWLRVDHKQYRSIVEHTTRVTELDNYYINDTPRHIAKDAPTYGESFEVVAAASTNDADEHFIITPHSDYTYTLTRSGTLRRTVFSVPVLFAVTGFVIGVLLTYAMLRNRNRNA